MIILSVDASRRRESRGEKERETSCEASLRFQRLRENEISRPVDGWIFHLCINLILISTYLGECN